MRTRSMSRRLTITATASALMFGALACEADNGEGLDPAQEDPTLEGDAPADETGGDDGGY